MESLARRWRADCSALAPGADPAVVDDIGEDLLRRWQEPRRRYHDATHLAEVLAAVDTLCAAGTVDATSRAVACVVAWFHDAVHTAGAASGDEARSAELAVTQLGRVGLAAERVERVREGVLDTASHALSGEVRADPARVVVHDADLWVLAAPVARFDEYCAQVREEYAHVPAADYASGRAAVLRPFLARDHVYVTEHARAMWEPAARENLARELTRLAG